MSKKNKKKKGTQSRKSINSFFTITKTYFDDFSITARKFMLLFGLEASAYDSLSKRTKHYLMQVKNTPIRIRAEKGGCIPDVFIKVFNKVMDVYEKTTFYGDPSFNITFLEYVTHGLTLITAVRNYETSDDLLTLNQFELLEKIKISLIKYTNENTEDHINVRVSQLMKYLFFGFSQPNFRYYTCRFSASICKERCCIENIVRVSSVEAERKKFLIEGKVHLSFRLKYYELQFEVLEVNLVSSEFPMNFLMDENSKIKKQTMAQLKPSINLPVYIQNHTLRRMAERLDCKDNLYCNQIFSMSFLMPKTVTATNGQLLIAAIDLTGKIVGYFPFVKQDGAILLLSFLPLASSITPEGSILHRELGIQLEDSKFIRLDKLSFYTDTDFEPVPILKQALKQAGMWHLTEIKPDYKSERKEDRILKDFFVNQSIYNTFE